MIAEDACVVAIAPPEFLGERVSRPTLRASLRSWVRPMPKLVRPGAPSFSQWAMPLSFRFSSSSASTSLVFIACTSMVIRCSDSLS